MMSIRSILKAFSIGRLEVLKPWPAELEISWLKQLRQD